MKKRAVLMIAVMLGILLLTVGCEKKEPRQIEEKAVPVEIFVAKKSNLSQEIEMTGEIIAGQDVDVTPKVSGKVASVNVKVGQLVKKGTVLFEIEGKEYEIALRTAETNLKSAQNNYDRMKQLYAEGAISKVEFENAETQLKLQQAAYDRAKNDYEELVVTSPINGQVSYLNVEKGELVGAQAPAAGVVNLDTVKVKLNVSENLVGSIKEGQKVSVEIDTLGKTVDGKIYSVSPKIDQVTKAFPVEVEIPNPKREILAGMVATIKLPTREIKNAVTVPASAVLEHNGQQKVYVVEDGIAKERIVSVGVRSLDKVQVISGLKENEKVIVAGNRLVGDGQKVKIIKSVDAAGGEK
ncbi:MAG: efflux RND transporter periplasmic adaptor subunit [Desulfotomaculum sp.]|nr:efflux RND transporter periplasmic adaptor subunit [Desulfotomaculum sp.]